MGSHSWITAVTGLSFPMFAEEDWTWSFRDQSAITARCSQSLVLMAWSCLMGSVSVAVSAVSGWCCGIMWYEVFVDRRSDWMRFKWVRKLREVFRVGRKTKGWWGWGS